MSDRSVTGRTTGGLRDFEVFGVLGFASAFFVRVFLRGGGSGTGSTRSICLCNLRQPYSRSCKERKHHTFFFLRFDGGDGGSSDVTGSACEAGRLCAVAAED